MSTSSHPVAVFLLVGMFTEKCLGDSDVKAYTPFEGQIKLYSGIYYNNLLLVMNFAVPNSCYNINCDGLDNKVASAKWSGLTTTGWAGKAFITFYADKKCGGNQQSVRLPHGGGIREFASKEINDNISSFMVRSMSRIRRHGVANVCSWSGFNLGGELSEADNKNQ